MKWGEKKNHLDNMRKSRLEEHGIVKARKKKGKKEKKEFECERVAHSVNCSRRPGMVDLVRECLVALRPWDVGAARVVEVFVWLGTSLSSKSRIWLTIHRCRNRLQNLAAKDKEKIKYSSERGT